MKKSILKHLFLLLPIFSLAQQSNLIDLHGEWKFMMDKEDIGLKETWYNNELQGSITLPGSMNSNGLGEDVSIETLWVGEILDSSWYTAPKYAKYRKEGNVKSLSGFNLTSIIWGQHGTKK